MKHFKFLILCLSLFAFTTLFANQKEKEKAPPNEQSIHNELLSFDFVAVAPIDAFENADAPLQYYCLKPCPTIQLFVITNTGFSKFFIKTEHRFNHNYWTTIRSNKKQKAGLNNNYNFHRKSHLLNRKIPPANRLS